MRACRLADLSPPKENNREARPSNLLPGSFYIYRLLRRGRFSNHLRLLPGDRDNVVQVQDRSRLLKLLEIATHSTAADGERLNALDAIRRMSDPVGGLEKLVSALFQEKDFAELEAITSALLDAVAENEKLKADINLLLQEKKAASAEGRQGQHKGSAKKIWSDSEKLVRSALTKEWQELHRIHEHAKASGYTGTSANTRDCLAKLCLAGKARTREAGSDKSRSNSWRPQCWSLRSWHNL
jgi:hypothetical protein